MLSRLVEMVDGQVVGNEELVPSLLKTMYSQPDSTTRESTKPGVRVCRNRPMKCPHCGDTFYYWSDSTKTYDEVFVQPIPKANGFGWITSRATCGSNVCSVKESDFSMKISPEWIRLNGGVNITAPNNNRVSRLIEVRDERS